ncbi:MAG TPA: nucleotidyl transferase AbiEii/AbiGii toxin family protein [Solirubrobacteraceae bacterium]
MKGRVPHQALHDARRGGRPVEAGGDEIEEIALHDLSTIGLDGPTIVPVLAVRWQIAQKLHAVTEPPLRPGGENPRYWDLIDLQLLQALTGENLAPVKDACQRIFAARGRQPWPPHVTTQARSAQPETPETLRSGSRRDSSAGRALD